MNCQRSMFSCSLKYRWLDSWHIPEWEDFQRNGLLRDIGSDRSNCRDFHRKSDRLSIWRRRDSAIHQRITSKGNLLRNAMMNFDRNSLRDMLSRIFLLLDLHRCLRDSYRHMFLRCCRHRSLGLMGKWGHRCELSYQRSSLVLLDIDWRRSMLSCLQNFRELWDKVLNKLVNYCQTKNHWDNGLNKFYLSWWRREQE